MSIVENLRPLHPLFASISHTFGDFSKRIKDGFWSLGASLLNLVYKDTIFDNAITLHPEETTEGNFDIIMNAAERISILQPIMRPHIMGPTMEEIRKQSEHVIAKSLNTLFPSNQETEKIVDSTTRKHKPSP